MPELPEVETIFRYLRDRVEGRIIHQVEIYLPRLIKMPDPEQFRAAMIGRKILRLERRGKYLLFHLDNNEVMVVHLRMTGRLFFRAQSFPANELPRIRFLFVGGDSLEYQDTRTLGTLYLLNHRELGQIRGLAGLGPEPLTAEFTPEYLVQGLAGRKGKIKSRLLDQSFIGGLGNIYVDESLARAGIHPERKSETLNLVEIVKLHEAINYVIEKSIRENGTTFRDYRDGAGNKGGFQNILCVYGRKGKPCPACGTAICKIEVGGRGTHFCPTCQKEAEKCPVPDFGLD